MNVLFIDAERSGYSVNQINDTMTVSELIEVLESIEGNFGGDRKIYLRHDGGYTYGGITPQCLEVDNRDDDDDWC